MKHTMPFAWLALGDATLSEPKKAHIEIIEVKLLDAPFRNEARFVRLNKAIFFFGTNPRKAIIWWIAQDDEDRLFCV